MNQSKFLRRTGFCRALALSSLLAGSFIAGCGGTESGSQTQTVQREKISVEPAFLARQCDDAHSPHLSCPGA